MEKKSNNKNKTCVGLLGGSFNPLHIGHLRVCAEMLEQAGLDHVELIPTHIPPHKDIKDILPFDLRLAMLESSVKDFAKIRVNPLESKRSGPSYTYDTLQILVRDNPEKSYFFIMGDRDLLTMPKWHMGREIALLSNLLVVGRQGEDDREVDDFISGFWDVETRSKDFWQIHQGKQIRYLSVPRIDISSSMLRSRWLSGKSIDWLVPPEVAKYLDMYKEEVMNVWQNSL
ncbi:MAG: nicotinate (nicotinamide) nucleotide adenylyltransferase [Desulfonatronovibrio sp.]